MVFTLMLNLRSLLTIFALAALLSPAAYAASASKVFTVTNTGNGPLTVSGAAISGNPAEFALVPGHNCTTVAAGDSCSMTVTFTPTASGPREAATLTYTSTGTNGPTHSIALSGTGAPSEITRLISANASDVNMAALFGNPTAAGTYVLTINSGVSVSASTAATAALTTGSFPAGSTVKIVNNGYIVGAGGAGGAAPSTWVAGGSGSPGGPALSLASSVMLDNTNGAIYGGGGGGGGGGPANMGMMGIYQGGGGGGGAGSFGGLGGAGWAAGTDGGQAGGPGGASHVYPYAVQYYGGAGGAGGNYGQAGSAGVAGYGSAGGLAGGAGGAAGRAILKNGNAITWLGGDNGTQVKGAVQ